MNVASKELCQEVFELSGWSDNEFVWHSARFDDGWRLDWLHNGDYFGATYEIPAYDLGYLLRKLPHHLRDGELVLDFGVDADKNVTHVDRYWLACYARFDDLNKGEIKGYADTPEDAAAKLAIELFKQGILKKEEA